MNYLILLLPAVFVYHYVTRPTLTFYWAEWCPHCKSVLDEWKSFNYPGVAIRSVEQRMNFERKVPGFPTWIYSDLNGSEVYTGPRTSEGWRSFLDSKKS